MKRKRYKFRTAQRINRKYKDRLFRFVFQNKRDLLELYNAINGTEYRIQKSWKSIRWRMCFILA